MKRQNKYVTIGSIVLGLYAVSSEMFKHYTGVSYTAYVFNFYWNLRHDSKIHTNNFEIKLPINWIYLGKNKLDIDVFQGVFFDIDGKNIAPTVHIIKNKDNFIENVIHELCEKPLSKKIEKINNWEAEVYICNQKYPFKVVKYQEDVFYLPLYISRFHKQYELFFDSLVEEKESGKNRG